MSSDSGDALSGPGSSPSVEPEVGLDASHSIPIADAETGKRFAAGSMRVHKTEAARVALRCALGDAAHLCDAVGRQIAEENRGGRFFNGPVKKHGREWRAIAKRCGDAIWAMRDLVTMPDERDGTDLYELAKRVHRAAGRRGTLADAEAFVAALIAQGVVTGTAETSEAKAPVPKGLEPGSPKENAP